MMSSSKADAEELTRSVARASLELWKAELKCAKCIRARLNGDAGIMQRCEMKERRLFLNAEKMRTFEYARETQWPHHRFWEARKTAILI
jgi:hypothetical protein